MIIAYCDKCGLRVPEGDITRGTAVKTGDNTYLCAQCAGDVPGAAPKRASGKLTIARQTPASSPVTTLSAAQDRPAATMRQSSGGVQLPVLPGVQTGTAPVRSARQAAATPVAGTTTPLSSAGNMVPIILGVTGGAVFLVGLIVAFSGRQEETRTPPKKEEIAPPPVVAKPDNSTVQPPPKTGPVVTAPDVTKTEPKEAAAPDDRIKAADKEMEGMRNDRAARLLEEHKAWFRVHPQDPWGYKQKLDALITSYRSSPAGVEAAKIVAELKTPEGEIGPESSIWHRGWQITPGAMQDMNDDFDGRRFVLATHPVAPGQPCVLSRKWKVPDDKPYLEFSIRGHENGDFDLIAVVSGRTVLKEMVKGRTWRTLALDLSALKGQEADISLQHHNTMWENEHGWWQAPHFVDKPPEGARVVAWNSVTVQAALPADDAWQNGVDLLALIDPAKDRVEGTWTVQPGEGLVSGAERAARVEIPFQPPEEYDVRVIFTRRTGIDCSFQTLLKSGHEFCYVIGGWQNTVTGFDQIGGVRCAESLPCAKNERWVNNGQNYTSVVQVRNDGIKTWLDGKLVCQWTTDFSNLGPFSEFKLRDASVLGIGSYLSEYCFHSIQLLEVTGKGKAGRGGAAVVQAVQPDSQAKKPGVQPVATPAVAPASANLLLDPGFESGTFGVWMQWQPASSISDNSPRTGKFSAKVGPKSGAGQKVSNLKPNTTYALSGWVLGSPGEDITIGVNDYGGPPNRFEGTNTSTEYKQITVAFTTGPNSTSAVCFYYKNAGKDFVFVDDMMLVQQGGAASASPAAGATGAAPAGGSTAVTQVAKPAADPAAEARLEYERAATDAYALLLKGGVRQAVARLEQARGDAKLTFYAAALEQDTRFAKYMEDVYAAAAKGAAALADKRPFVLRRTDGKESPVGQGSKNAVLRVKDDQIEIEMDLGGGAKAGLKVAMEQLTPQTRYELARIGLGAAGAPPAGTPAPPDAEMKLAFADLLLLNGGVADVNPKTIRAQLDAAKKAGADAVALAHVLKRLEAYEHEAAVVKAYAKLDGLVKDKKWPDAKAAIEGLQKEFAGTIALAKLQPELDKQWAQVDDELNPARPGLWASYWASEGENWFAKFLLARPDGKLSYNWGEGSPDPKVPVDNFAVKWAGVLRAERDGKYRFKAWADDRVEVWVNGTKILDGGQEADAALVRGDNKFKVAYREFGGSASVGVQWRLEGAFDWQEIPANLLWHDPRQAEKYQKE